MTTGGFDPNLPPQYPQPGFGAPAVKPGGLGLRLVARVIDGILISIVAGLIGSLFGSDSDSWIMDSRILVAGMFSGLLTFVYFLLFESRQGWTPGKKLLGLRVQGPNGAPKPTASQAATRNLFTLLALIPWLGWILAPIAYIVIAMTISSSPTKQGKHDRMAGGTQVLENA